MIKSIIVSIMKKAIIILSLLVLGLLVISCSSNEDKANKLIKERMSKTLYDYGSYDPIETIVTEAKASIYTDTSCWMAAVSYYQIWNLHDEYCKKAEEAKEKWIFGGLPQLILLHIQIISIINISLNMKKQRRLKKHQYICGWKLLGRLIKKCLDWTKT